MKKRVLKIVAVGFLAMAVLVTVPKVLGGTTNTSTVPSSYDVAIDPPVPSYNI